MVLVHSVFSGARWGGGAEGTDMHTLVDSKPKELFTQMAPIWFKCEENRVKPKTGIYDCPCYKILTRKGALLAYALLFMFRLANAVCRCAVDYWSQHQLRAHNGDAFKHAVEALGT